MGEDIMEPIRVKGRTIAESWWGKAWNANLESYSDYENRLPRGRTYLRNGSVIDLKIDGRHVRAKVRGSSPRPYSVQVDIAELDKRTEKRIVDECAGKVSNVEALVDGRFPEEVGKLFLSQNGLFPRPSEIKFSCSCPDYAYMCKHVAAVLYGIGRKLDSDPTLFFKLRNIDIDGLVGKTAQAKLESMLANADRPSSRILGGDRVAELFGMALEDCAAEIAPAVEEPAPPAPAPEPEIGCELPDLAAETIRASVEDAVEKAVLSHDPPTGEGLSDGLSQAFFGILTDCRFKGLDPNEILLAIAAAADIAVRRMASSPHREADYLVAELIESAKAGKGASAFLDLDARS